MVLSFCNRFGESHSKVPSLCRGSTGDRSRRAEGLQRFGRRSSNYGGSVWSSNRFEYRYHLSCVSGCEGAVTGAGVAVVLVVGAALIAVSFVISMVQLYIARSRIEDFSLCHSGATHPRCGIGMSSPGHRSGQKLLESSRVIASADEGGEVQEYFETELDAFYYTLFSPIVRITEHMSEHWDITRQGEQRVLSEFTSIAVYFPGFSEGACTCSIKLLEVDTSWFGKDEVNDITGVFYRMKRVDASTEGVLYEFTHYNHNKCGQLEMLIHYEKDGRKVTGENGLRLSS